MHVVCWREKVPQRRICSNLLGLVLNPLYIPCMLTYFVVLGNVTDRAGIEPRVARSRVQRLNHWAIKVPERPSRLRLAGSLHYSPLFEIRAPWLGPLSTKAGSFHSQANPGYRCHQCNGPCGYRTPGRSLQSPTPKPLGHKGTWTTQSLTLGWFVTGKHVSRMYASTGTSPSFTHFVLSQTERIPFSSLVSQMKHGKCCDV